MITALVLFAVATAGVKGFALMLLIGTRDLARHRRRRDARDARPARRLPLVRQPALHGRRRASSAGSWLQIDFMGRRYLWFAISGAIVVDRRSSRSRVKGLNLGIDFKGGTQITFFTPTARLALGRPRRRPRDSATATRSSRAAARRSTATSTRASSSGLKSLEPGRDDSALERHQGAVRRRTSNSDPDRLGELRAADRALGDHRDPLLAAPDHRSTSRSGSTSSSRRR